MPPKLRKISPLIQPTIEEAHQQITCTVPGEEQTSYSELTHDEVDIAVVMVMKLSKQMEEQNRTLSDATEKEINENIDLMHKLMERANLLGLCPIAYIQTVHQYWK
jgi:hypothetical protein